MKKSKTRIFIKKKLSLNDLVNIEGKLYHFLKNVLRVKINDEILLFDNLTGEWLSKVSIINKKNLNLKIFKKIRNFTSEPDIWLVFAPIKPQRLKITIQKATELGISKFIPCITEYTSTPKINNQNLLQNKYYLNLNDFPYNVEENIEHWLLWWNNNLDIDEIIIKKFGNKVITYWVNFPENNSISDIKHAHIFVIS